MPTKAPHEAGFARRGTPEAKAPSTQNLRLLKSLSSTENDHLERASPGSTSTIGESRRVIE